MKTNESDLHMLSRVLKENGMAMKIIDNHLVVFDEQFYESKPPVMTFDFSQPAIWGLEKWNLTTEAQDIYSAAQVFFYDPKTGETGYGSACHPEGTNTTGSGEILNVTGDIPTQTIAETQAEKSPPA